jgi:hypothetical protein
LKILLKKEVTIFFLYLGAFVAFNCDL